MDFAKACKIKRCVCNSNFVLDETGKLIAKAGKTHVKRKILENLNKNQEFAIELWVVMLSLLALSKAKGRIHELFDWLRVMIPDCLSSYN